MFSSMLLHFRLILCDWPILTSQGIVAMIQVVVSLEKGLASAQQIYGQS